MVDPAALTPLPRTFYERDTLAVAQALLGQYLVHQTDEGLTIGQIVETEAYMGPHDAGAHSYQGRRTARTEAMYGPGGYAYIFRIYGMYVCFNAVTARPLQPEAVLVRALQPLLGLALMARRRQIDISSERPAAIRNLCNGPGKLCMAMGITTEHYGADLNQGSLCIATAGAQGAPPFTASPRINIDYAGEWREKPWRFCVKGNPFVSKPWPTNPS